MVSTCSIAKPSLRSKINLRNRTKNVGVVSEEILADVNVKTATVMAPLSATSTWRWLAIAAAFLLFIYGGWRIATVNRGDSHALIASKIVDTHLRSLQPGTWKMSFPPINTL